MSLFDTIINTIKPFDADTAVRENELTITNRQNGKTISVFAETYYSEDKTEHFSETIVEFSTQHRHFEDDDAEEATDYILAVMQDKILPLEFYRNGQRRFGGELDRSENPNADLSKWLARIGYDIAQYTDFEYEITSWSGRYDTGRQKVTK